jgi:hypothetical protein
VARFAVNQAYGTIEVKNILDMHLDLSEGTTGDTREERCFDQAGRIINAWDDNLRVLQVNDLSCLSVSWLDLDSLTGSVGERASTTTNAWPATGALADAPSPSFSAIRVEKRTTAARGLRGGRMFMAGVNEGQTDVGGPNTIAAAALTSLNNGLAAFLAALGASTAVGAQGYFSELVVVHRPAIGAPSWSPVSALTALSIITHQVRRR